MQTRCFTTHHPLPHVLLLGGVILAGYKLFGSYNAGIAAYTLLQMLMMAGVFSFTVMYMKQRKANRILRSIAVLYFAFFPVILMFSLCSAKDGIFSAALLILLLETSDMGKEPESFLLPVNKLLFF